MLTLDNGFKNVIQYRFFSREDIHLTNAGNNILTLTTQDVLDLSDTTDQLTVDGNVRDTLNSTAQGWVDGGVSAGYHTYTHGLAMLLVDTNITGILS